MLVNYYSLKIMCMCHLKALNINSVNFFVEITVYVYISYIEHQTLYWAPLLVSGGGGKQFRIYTV